MEKNRIRPVVNGNSMRMSYSRQKEVLQMPNLIEVQKDSYEASRLAALMESAADSVAKDGIGCTSQLEFGLNSAAQTMCRELLEALLTSDAAKCSEYERTPNERHGGIHEKKVATLFGLVASSATL